MHERADMAARAGQYGCMSGQIWLHERANMDFARAGLYGERND